MIYLKILFFTLPLIMFLSLLFLRMLHPLSMGLLLLMQTILVSITSGLINKSFWFSYILFLIFLGAMLVLFIYVASLASNEQFNFKIQTSIIISVASFCLMMIFIFLDSLSISNKIFIPFSSSTTLMKTEITSSLTSSIYNLPSSSFTLFIIMYLLLTLLVVVKVMKVFSSPLRTSN
uniref:NADH-ubiquinone oxidoreductase chain 6 n=1 Tax=Aegla aff. longirostri MHT-2018 TaxID=2070338 RepID=A0A343S8U6_9EUCA|nr:NADH dehydrogenase subunit 6 [Aegla aff. longirostri MHT-2018]